MIEINFLADYPEVIPTLARWFQTQWPDYYAERAQAEIAQDFFAEAKRDGLPVRLVAFTEGELSGTITLRDRAVETLPDYHPGIGGLFVMPRYRGRGIGTALVRAGMGVARAQGYASVYATTVAAGGILARLEWQRVRAILHRDEPLVLYRCDLEAADHEKAQSVSPKSR